MLVEKFLDDVEDLGIPELDDFFEKWTDYLEVEFSSKNSWPLIWTDDFDPEIVETVDLP